ncbi:MAG: dihydroxyacetone kinase transcriptional activator DhaS [Lactobacillus sp.]|nr:dihydroxyacetone kinase transcriptional activator DhaS [Lactobacillus sp.]
MSYITQKKVAMVVKQMLIAKDFDTITVTQIMHQAQVRRQSFYDYFRDKYDVLTWIYNDEIKAVLNDNLDYEHWTLVLTHTLRYFQNNRDFYIKVFAIHDQNAPEAVISQHIESLIRAVYTDISAQAHLTTTDAQAAFSQRVIAMGLVAEVKRWLVTDTQATLDQEMQLLQNYLSDSIQGLLTNHRPSS